MKILDHSLFQRTRSLTLAAIALLSFVIAGCVSHEAGVRQEVGGSARQAAALLAKARHTQDTSARIGLTLVAADKASQSIAEGNAPRRAHALQHCLRRTGCVAQGIVLRAHAARPPLRHRQGPTC